VRVEQGRLGARAPARRLGDERAQEPVHGLRWSVVGVYRDRDVETGRQFVSHRGEGACAGRRVAAAEVGGAADGDLDDAVRVGLREAAQDAVERLRGGDVDGGIGEALRERAIEHLGVLLRRRYGHGASIA
jgi:hypothetical protein